MFDIKTTMTSQQIFVPERSFPTVGVNDTNSYLPAPKKKKKKVLVIKIINNDERFPKCDQVVNPVQPRKEKDDTRQCVIKGLFLKSHIFETVVGKMCL